MTFIISNIEWDTKRKGLPTTLTIEADDVDEALDIASEEYGWCIIDCTVQECNG